MHCKKAGGAKRPIAIMAISIILLLLISMVSINASAVELGQEESPAADSIAIEDEDTTEPEEMENQPEDVPEEADTGEEEEGENGDEEPEKENAPENEEEPEEEKDPIEDEEEALEEEETEQDLPLFGRTSIQLADAPQTAEAVAELVEAYPYGGSEEEKEEFLENLPKWEEALDSELLPKGWTQKENGTQQTGYYYSLYPDLENFALIFDGNSLESFLLLSVSGTPKTGLLVNDIQLERTITHSGTKNYSGHVLDGDGHTVYAPESGRHMELAQTASTSLSFTDITFDGNGTAGGIKNTGNSTLTAEFFMENVSVQNCVLTGKGTVHLTQIKGTVTDSSFVGNMALEGGGIYITGRGALTFENCRIEENKAESGGGVYINYETSGTAAQVTATFTDCSINGNSSKDGSQSHGMGMYVNNVYGTVNITNSSLSGNYMEGSGYGVGLYVKNTASLTISGTEINDNYGEGNAYGGAFFVDKGKFILRDSLVQNNQTQMYFGGGALYNRDFTTITATITNTDFIGNYTRERGPSEQSTNGGGGLGIISLSYATRVATTKVAIDGCKFIANRAAPSTEHSYGGGINIALMSTSDDVTIRNTDFERNSAANGGAMFVLALDTKKQEGYEPGYYRADAVKLENCTFKYNVATVAGGAIGTEMMNRMAEQTNYYNAIKGTGVSFIDNMAPTGHQLPKDAQAYQMIAYAVERQFGVDVLNTSNADPSRLPLTSPFVVNHSDKYYRSPYNNYDIAQNYSSTVVTSGMYKFTYHANGADSLSDQETFTFQLMPERNVLLLAPDDGSMGFTMAGYNFVEWNTAYDGSGEGYQPGDIKYLYTTDFNDAKEFVLYAIWEYNPGAFTVTYKNTQGNETHVDPVPSLVSPQKVLGVQQTGFTAPDGHVFENWKDSAGNTYRPGDEFQYDYTAMGANYTLTAQWTEQPDHVLYLRYVDSDGAALESGAVAQNPQEVYAGDNEQVVVGQNLAGLTRYKALYYTIEGADIKYSLTDDPFTMTAEKDGTTLLVYCASTMLDISVPSSIQFFAMSSSGADVYSPVYSFQNDSDLPAEVRFAQLNTSGAGLENLGLDTDGVSFVEEAANPYEMHLSLEADSKTANNGFAGSFTGTNGKPGIQPDTLYTDAVVAKLAGGLVKGEGNGPLGAFTIGGRFAGPYELNLRTPKVALQFHVSLLHDAEYEW